MRIYMLIVALLLVVNVAWGAQVYGGIYDQEANSISKTEVFINTSPPQRHISKYGGYSFEVGPGSYQIIANLTLNNVTKTIATQVIEVTSDGEYRIDLSVDPSVDLEQSFVPDPWYLKPYWLIFMGVLGGLIIFVIVALFVRRKSTAVSNSEVSFEVKEDQTQVEISHEVVEEVETKVEEDPLQKRIIKVIKSKGGSCTQKEIRKELPFSSAKVSMVLSELEQLGKVKKEKKGRSNIIVLS